MGSFPVLKFQFMYQFSFRHCFVTCFELALAKMIFYLHRHNKILVFGFFSGFPLPLPFPYPLPVTDPDPPVWAVKRAVERRAVHQFKIKNPNTNTNTSLSKMSVRTSHSKSGDRHHSNLFAADTTTESTGGNNNSTAIGKNSTTPWFELASSSVITNDLLAQWRKNFYSEPKNLLAQNVCSRVDPFDVCLSRKALETTNHVFNYKVETEGKPITNQRSSGRCWLFAALNCIRLPFMKNYNLDEFEFSQAFLFYWDKIERCNYFLNNIVKTAHRGEKVDGRLVSFLLLDPTSDGGQWDMLVNLITKHGLMPKKCFPESFSCESSIRMNAILKSKVLLPEITYIYRVLYLYFFDYFSSGSTPVTCAC